MILFNEIISTFRKFWQKHPALLVGVLCLLACAVRVTGEIFYWIPFALVLLPYCGFRIGLAVTAAILSVFQILPTPPIHSVAKVTGTFYPASVKEKKTPFGPKWEYQGTLALKDKSSIPIKIALPLKPFMPRPNADFKYKLEGVIQEGFLGPLFIPAKHSKWVPIEPIRFGVGEWRFHAKSLLKKQIRKRFSSEKAARFMEGISTGDFQDRVMSMEFGRFGLQHIMAVSGFHFAIITGILSWLFIGLLGRRLGSVLLLCSLLGYFVLLGGSPSITRAWIAASLMMLGILLGSRVKSLNSLGLGLFVVLALDPKAFSQLGFQFSFAITASILLFTRPIEFYLSEIFPVRRLHSALSMGFIEKGCYIFLQWIKKGTALSIAVNLCALPMTLYFFGKFPLWSLFFNLFFPFMVAIAMFFLILGLTAGIALESIGFAPNMLTNWFTDFMLNLAYNFPQKWDVNLSVTYFTTEIIVLYLSILFLLGIFMEGKHDQLDRLKLEHDY